VVANWVLGGGSLPLVSVFWLGVSMFNIIKYFSNNKNIEY
jgi:hypothetical protein